MLFFSFLSSMVVKPLAAALAAAEDAPPVFGRSDVNVLAAVPAVELPFYDLSRCRFGVFPVVPFAAKRAEFRPPVFRVGDADLSAAVHARKRPDHCAARILPVHLLTGAVAIGIAAAGSTAVLL